MYKLIELNNENSIGNREIGKNGEFNYNGSVFSFNSIRSSSVKVIVKDDEYMVIITKNSTYKFKEVKNVQ